VFLSVGNISSFTIPETGLLLIPLIALAVLAVVLLPVRTHKAA